MTVNYTGNLKFGYPVTGTEPGTWGDVVNNQITALVDQSVSGTVSLTSMTNADYTLTNGNGNAANEARYMALLVPSTLTLTAARNIIVPSTSKMYIVKNATTGGFSVTVKTSGGTGIEVPNGRTMMLYCNGTNVIVAFDAVNLATLNGGQLAGLRNKLLNGGMDIAQRGTTVTVNPGQAGFGVDRTSTITSVLAAVIVASQTADAPPNNEFQNSLRNAVTTAQTSIGAAAQALVQQRIEGYNVRDLIGNTFTVSFWVRSSKTGVHCLALNNSSADRSYIMEYSISVANTWEKKSLTVPGGLITAGTWNWTNGIGLYVNWVMANGAIFQSASTNSWLSGIVYSTANQVNCLDTVGNIFAVTGLQLEVGSVATPFEHRPIGEELLLCQRYFEKSYSQPVAPGSASVTGYEYWYNAQTSSSTTIKVPFKVPKRSATGTIVVYSPSTGSSGVIRNETGAADVAAITSGVSENGFLVSSSSTGALAFYSAQWTAASEL